MALGRHRDEQQQELWTATATAGSFVVNAGVTGFSDDRLGVVGITDSGTAIVAEVHDFGLGGTGFAGGFFGPVHITDTSATALTVTGDVSISGTLTASAKNFRIDHPLDPANKWHDRAGTSQASAAP